MNDTPSETPKTPAITGDSLIRVDARAAADERGVRCAPASLLLAATDAHPTMGLRAARRLRLLALAPPDQLPEHTPDLTLTRPDAVLNPPLITAPAHLDLTHMGPRPHDPEEGFVAWVDQIRAERHQRDEDIASTVREGARLLLAGGVSAVGDIAGAPAGRLTLAPYRALRTTPLAGVSYLEFFGIGATRDRARTNVDALLRAHAAEISAPGPVRFGLQPHAPNTVALQLYRWAAARAHELALPLSTHLSETPEEVEFIAHASGPQRELLERLGVWTDDIEAGHGLHPIEHLRPFLEDAQDLSPPLLVAHVNALGKHAPLLRAMNVSVAYCPRASAYFAAERHFGAHPYRDLLDAGVNVCLGTDSIVNLPPEHATGPGARISVLDEMRLLFRRDATPPDLLLRMGTTNAARPLGLEPSHYRLDPGGEIAGLLAVPAPGGDPLEGVMRSSSSPEFLFIRNLACDTGFGRH
ncbi:MAG: amidohydrolase family protein [Phycisphaerales bacterium JB059]